MPTKISAEQYGLYVGIDVSAATVSVAWGTHKDEIGRARTFEQTRSGHGRLVRALAATGYPAERTRVVMEATGTYWMRGAVALHTAGYAVCVINPRQAHNYMKSEMQDTKTDAVDARLLARLGTEKSLTVWEPADTFAQALEQRLVERDQLLEKQQMVRNELHALAKHPVPDPAVVARKEQLLTEYARLIKVIDRELRTLLMASPWAAQARRLMSIPGIGLLGATWLLVVTRGFTTCERSDQLTSYLGLIPHRNDSGTRKSHKPLGNLGHARARRVLYQCAVSASRFNPTICDFYQRLIANGKHSKVARCAAARKLVRQAFAIVTKESTFDPTYHLSQPVQALAA